MLIYSKIFPAAVDHAMLNLSQVCQKYILYANYSFSTKKFRRIKSDLSFNMWPLIKMIKQIST